MSSVNKIVMIGTVSTPPEVRVTTEGTSMTRLTLIVQRGGVSQDKTDTIPVVCWGKLAEQVGESFQNDQMVLVEGRIQNRSFDDKDGQKVYTTEVVANFAKVLDGKNHVAHVAGDVVIPLPNNESEPYAEDDIPF